MQDYKICFILNDKEIENFSTSELNTSLSLIQECVYRNYQVYVTPTKNLFLDNNKPKSIVYKGHKVSNKSQTLGLEVDTDHSCLNDFDMILIRKDPPINMDYIFSTYILDYVDQSKTLVINNPSGIRKANEKLYISNFPEFAPKSIATSNIELIEDFLDEHNEMIIKPLDNYGGNGIFYIKKGDKNLYSILESSTNNQKRMILAQEYLGKNNHEDKRLILLGGKPIASIIRLSNENDFRANMSKGGSLKKGEITDFDKEVCQKISGNLLEDGLFFVGLDLMDNKITEINVTSPGFFIRKINSLLNIKLEEKVVDYMESLLKTN